MRWDPVHNRLAPQAGPQHFRTFTVNAPLATHWRRGTCEEVGCIDMLNGFVTTVDVNTSLGQKQYHFLTHDPDRSYSMQRVGPTLYKFIYKPGNPCFKRKDHRVAIGRPPHYLVCEGDWRGNPRKLPPVRHRTVEDWVDQFANHQDKVDQLIKRG